MKRSRPMLVLFVATFLASCGPRVLIVTGTTLGLKATPGDGSSRPPQVTLGYKRAETAVVPTKGTVATKTSDAYSVLAAFDFRSEWFGKTELASFVASGNAARDIQTEDGTGKPSAFAKAFAEATVVPTPVAVHEQRKRLMARWEQLDESGAALALGQIENPVPTGWTAKQWLQDVIAKAGPPELAALEDVLPPAGD